MWQSWAAQRSGFCDQPSLLDEGFVRTKGDIFHATIVYTIFV